MMRDKLWVAPRHDVLFLDVRYAQQPRRRMAEAAQPRAEDQRVLPRRAPGALQAGPQRLTHDQEKSWPAFEKGLRELAARQRGSGLAKRGPRPTGDRTQAGDPIQRAQRQAITCQERCGAPKRMPPRRPL